jgi:hypothetical protein
LTRLREGLEDCTATQQEIAKQIHQSDKMIEGDRRRGALVHPRQVTVRRHDVKDALTYSSSLSSSSDGRAWSSSSSFFLFRVVMMAWGGSDLTGKGCVCGWVKLGGSELGRG